MKLKKLAEMIVRLNEHEGLNPAALGALKDFAIDCLKQDEDSSQLRDHHNCPNLIDGICELTGQDPWDEGTNP